MNPWIMRRREPRVKTAVRVSGSMRFKNASDLTVDVRLVLPVGIERVEQEHVDRIAGRRRRDVGKYAGRHLGQRRERARGQQVGRVFLKEVDGLRLAVLEYLEILLAQAGHRLAIAASDHHVDDDVAGLGGKDRRPGLSGPVHVSVPA